MDVHAVLIEDRGLIRSILGVFSTKELAEAYVKNLVDALNKKVVPHQPAAFAAAGQCIIRAFGVDKECAIDWDKVEFAINC